MKLYIFAHNMSCRETRKGDWTMSWNFAHQPICITPPSTLPVLPFLPPVLLPALLPTSPPSLPDKNGSVSSCQNHWPFTNFLFRIRCVWVCVCVCVRQACNEFLGGQNEYEYIGIGLCFCLLFRSFSLLLFQISVNSWLVPDNKGSEASYSNEKFGLELEFPSDCCPNRFKLW